MQVASCPVLHGWWLSHLLTLFQDVDRIQASDSASIRATFLLLWTLTVIVALGFLIYKALGRFSRRAVSSFQSFGREVQEFWRRLGVE